MSEALFSYNPDVGKNAYMNWRTDSKDQTHNLYVLASDFAEGAETMINAILSDNKDKKADALIMPILYSIDQSIELYIKAIIRLLEELSGGSISKYKHHDIAMLKDSLVGKIKEKQTTTKGLEKHLKPVSDFIDELYSKIKCKDGNGKDVIKIDFARYPFDIEGNPHFYIEEPGNVVIDIENLSSKFEEIRNCLESLYLMYESEKENLN